MHRVELEVSRWFDDLAPAGAALSVDVRVRCHEGCDLQGGEVSVSTPDGPVALASLGPSDDEDAGASSQLSIQAPSYVGTHDWSVSFEPEATEPQEHPQVVLPLPFETRAHRGSLAVWDVRSPTVMGDLFSVKVGAKCADGCELRGRAVEVKGPSGGSTSEAEGGALEDLTDTVWPGSHGLFWAEVGLVAPPEEGVFWWSVELPESKTDPPHDIAPTKFSLATTRAPDHALTVEVVEEGSGHPVPRAELSLGVHRATTDTAGRAVVHLPKGDYDLVVWQVEYEVPSRQIRVTSDLTVRVEATLLPDRSSWEDD